MVMEVDDEVRRKRRSKKGRVDEKGRREGVESDTDQSVLAGQGMVVEFGGFKRSGRIRSRGGMQKGNNTQHARPTNQEGLMP
jgi:hypothetical protein